MRILLFSLITTEETRPFFCKCRKMFQDTKIKVKKKKLKIRGHKKRTRKEIKRRLRHLYVLIGTKL